MPTIQVSKKTAKISAATGLATPISSAIGIGAIC
jgi:hypothetical protein